LKPPPSDEKPSDDPIVAAFKKSLKAYPGLQVAGSEELENQDAGWTTDSYLELLARHPDVNVIVSFAGAPQFSGAALRQAPAQHPKLIVARDDFRTLKRAMIEAGVVNVAILRKVNPNAKTISTSFADNYQVVTAANASQLP
jgi:ABC-type sugar transport system substrate-binding protein